MGEFVNKTEAAMQGYPTDMHPVPQNLYFVWRWLVFGPFSVVNTMLTALAAMAVSPFSESAAYRCTQIWAGLECLGNMTRQRVRGQENVVPGQAYVVMINHQSAFDFAVISALPMDMRWVTKIELRSVPFFGWACTAAGSVWIDRSDKARAISSLNEMRSRLSRGISLQIFPEGTRSLDGKLGPFKKGGFMLALELGIPILPVTTSGSGTVWPPHTWRILPGTIDYTIHPPIDVQAYGPERCDELMEAVRCAMASGLAQEAA